MLASAGPPCRVARRRPARDRPAAAVFAGVFVLWFPFSSRAGRAPGAPIADPTLPILADMDPKLLDRLVCPLTKAPLVYRPASQELVSARAGLAYPVRDGIPILLEEEARPLSPDEVARSPG